MSIRRGNSVIASSGSNGLQMFDMKWSDHTIDDLNWISSHSNSYHSGNTYKKMYNHLVEDYHNGVDETEVIDSYTISYKLAPDGHKIVDAVSSGVVDNIYEATGIAWYYVLDTTNQQFKLPRTKYGFTGLRDTVGNYVPESLPNYDAIFVNHWRDYSTGKSITPVSGAITVDSDTYPKSSYPDIGGISSGQYTYDQTLKISPSLSNSTYQDNAPVQERATQMLLYFYTDQFSVNGSSIGNSFLKDDWGASLRGDIEVDNTFICAPYKCYENQFITSFSAPNVEDISMAYCFYGCTSLQSISFPSLTTIGQMGLYCCFQYCTSLTTAPAFANLTTIGTRGLYSCFYGCTSLTTAPAFANLTTIGTRGLYSCFYGCTSLTTAPAFANLTTIGQNGLYTCFYGCTSLQSISFPSLTTQSFGNYTNQFINLLGNTGTSVTHTIHFPSNLESTIQGLDGYPLFGGTSGYVVLAFDLPATS